jgi:transcriptional regulator with XRE-family HTH domain
LSSLFPEFYDRALGQLVLARKKARITQSSLAATLGRPQSFVAKYESGERRLDAAEFVGIARAVGADPFKMLRAVEKGQ